MLLIPLVAVAGIIWCFVTSLFIISIALQRNDIADVAWGPGIFLVALSSYAMVPQHTPIMTVVLGLITLWAARLGWRILTRNKKRGEDFRYKRWRETWGRWFYVRSYGQVYLLQGLLMIVVGYGAIHAALFSLSHPTIGLVTGIGIVVWLLGFAFEAIGDYQLDAFLQNPAHRGKLITTGLWRYSRHPNYFGEITMWWGIWIMLLPLSYAYYALVSPVVITGLIVFVSGIPLVEAKMSENPAFAAYKQQTSRLIPWFVHADIDTPTAASTPEINEN